MHIGCMQDCSMSFTRPCSSPSSHFLQDISFKPFSPFHLQKNHISSKKYSISSYSKIFHQGTFTIKGRRMNAWNRIKGFFNNNDDNDSSHPPLSHPNEVYETSSYPGLDQIPTGYTHSASPSTYYAADTYPSLDNIPESGVYNGLYQDTVQGRHSTQSLYPNMAPEPVESEVFRPSFDGVGDYLAACNLNTPKKPGKQSDRPDWKFIKSLRSEDEIQSQRLDSQLSRGDPKNQFIPPSRQ